MEKGKQNDSDRTQFGVFPLLGFLRASGAGKAAAECLGGFLITVLLSKG